MNAIATSELNPSDGHSGQDTFLPLSVAQRGLWFGQKIGPDDATFNIAEYIEIHGPVDVALFRAALRQVAMEAETIRARVVDDADFPRQQVEPEFRGEIPYFDVSGEADPRAVAEGWMMAELTRPVDFDRDPLWVCALFKEAPDRFGWYHRGHHIILDGFAGGLIARRVAELYSALVEGRPPAPCDFGPLALLLENETAYRASDRFGRDRAYWVERLAGIPPAVSLAARPATRSGGLLRSTALLPAEHAGRLRQLARAAGASLPQILIAFLAAYYYRATGAEDLVFGMPVSGRLSPLLRRTPGMLANAVPIRLAMSGGMTLEALVQQVSKVVRQALRHQQYRYEDLRRDLGLIAQGQQISWLGVNVEPFDYDLRFGGHRATPHNLSNGTVEDLTVFIYDRGDAQGLRIDFDANPALYRRDELDAHRDRLLRLIDSLLAAPEVPIGQVDILDPEERRCLLVGFNDTARTIPNALLPELFEARVAAAPEAVAVVAGERSLSYGQLNRRANRVAHGLIGRGIGPGKLVALALPRDETMLVALLGVLKSGAAYLPLDPDFPAERLQQTLADAGPALLLTTRDVDAGLPVTGVERFHLDQSVLESGDQLSGANPSAAERLGRLDSESAAYVIYTSGSTGRPKGVVVPHRGLSNFLAAMQAELNLDPADRLLAVTTLSFDIAALELFLPLLAGARVVIAPKAVVRDPDALAALIGRSGITVLQATPSLWQALLADHAEVLRGVRPLVGGEPLPGPLARAMHRLGGKVTNLYGPTETTVWSTLMTLDEGELDTPPIGRPIWNTQVYVLDCGLQPVPAGVPGDLYIAGDGVAVGYLNRPGLTAERFVPNPYGAPGSRFYRTGDVARWRADGVLEFLGRNDHQIKIRGFRVEAGDIESALTRCPGVKEAVVLAREASGGEKRLVAYLVPATGVEVDAAGLRQRLGETLPDYMIPAAFVVLEAFPLTPNGKIDRKVLPAPAWQAASGYVAPRTPTEERLARLWADIFGLERVGIHDNFFELGGDSLTAARMIARIRTECATALPLGALFNGATIAELATHLAGSAERDPLAVLLPIRAEGQGAPLFCVHPVIGLGWGYAGLLRYLEADRPVYALQARGLRQAEALPRSIEEMADDYLAQLRRVQPRGPYHLLGWSLGGLVAHAMARRLEESGERVAQLVMLDAYPFVQRGGEQAPAEAELARAALGFLGYPASALGDAPLSMSAVADFLCDDYDVLSMPIVKEMATSNREIVACVRQVTENNLALARRFVPGRVAADLQFFVATERGDADLSDLLDHRPEAWSAYVTGRIKVHAVACHHQDMLQPGPLDEIGRVLATAAAVPEVGARPCPVGLTERAEVPLAA